MLPVPCPRPVFDAVLDRDEGEVVAGAGVTGAGSAGLLAVLEHVEGEPLRVVDGGVEIGGGVLDAGVQARQFGQGAFAAAELVAGHGAAVAGEEVVHAQPEFDQEGPAFLVLALLLVGQEAQRSGEDPGERAEDGDGGLQRLHVVGSDAQQPVAFDHRLLDQAELAVLEVPDAAVDHVRGRAAGSLAVVAALHEGDVHTLQGQVPERAHSVDAAADDQHLGMGPRPQLLHRCSLAGRCLVAG